MKSGLQISGPRMRASCDVRFLILMFAVVLFAFLIREYFVLVTVVNTPIRGDIREYVLYAWNLFHHGVFSMAAPQAAAPLPDAYRAPGYPWLLALCMFLRPNSDGWYSVALQMQVVLGTATVWFTLLIARYWLRQGWVLATGVLIAVWPHHVAATGALLSEVAFGCALMGALYCFARALDDRRPGFLFLSALVFGYAYLINPLIALFPAALAFLVWREQGRKPAILFTAIFLIPALVLGLRNAQIDESRDGHRPGRVAVNFIQGSWPQYHQAWQMQSSGDAIAAATMQEISREIVLLDEAPGEGVRTVANRFAKDPGYYAAWYLWEKPLLLWDWNIRIGYGGAYVLAVSHSPLETNRLLRWSSAVLEVLNPLLTLLGFGGTLYLLIGGAQRRPPTSPPIALATAGIALYLTAIHALLQAEPRYANAYRGIEALLIVTFLQFVWKMAKVQSKKMSRLALGE